MLKVFWIWSVGIPSNLLLCPSDLSPFLKHFLVTQSKEVILEEVLEGILTGSAGVRCHPWTDPLARRVQH